MRGKVAKLLRRAGNLNHPENPNYAQLKALWAALNTNQKKEVRQ